MSITRKITKDETKFWMGGFRDAKNQYAIATTNLPVTRGKDGVYAPALCEEEEVAGIALKALAAKAASAGKGLVEPVAFKVKIDNATGKIVCLVYKVCTLENSEGSVFSERAVKNMEKYGFELVRNKCFSGFTPNTITSVAAKGQLEAFGIEVDANVGEEMPLVTDEEIAQRKREWRSRKAKFARLDKNLSTLGDFFPKEEVADEQ